MRCYVAWNDCVEPGTPERARAEVRAKLTPVKYVVDFKVASEATSKIALNRPGADLLFGRGHLAAKLNGKQGSVYAQAPFLSDDDITAAVTAISLDNLPGSAHGAT